MTSLPSSKPRPERRAPSAALADLDPRPIRALLEGIVDYAGLFPPAGLDMRSAVSAYERYRSGEHAWMLGAFIVPAERLDELCAGAGRLAVSILVASRDEGARLLDGALDRFDVRALEIAPQDPKRIRAWADAKGVGVQVFHEVPLDEGQEARLDAIAAAGAAAKVRTGGVTAAAFPPPVLLADFIRSCAERGVPFKATAGLHHPLRGRYPLTYDSRSARGEMFGFLEVALAAALLRLRRIDTDGAAALLVETRPEVQATSDVLVWSGHRLCIHEIAEARGRFFRSFGSCSFEEPAADLERLGLL